MFSASATPLLKVSGNQTDADAHGENNSLSITEIISAIVGHQSLPATMQRIADIFLGLYPSKGIAIFLRNGSQFRIEAEAGLPKRLARSVRLLSEAGNPAMEKDAPQAHSHADPHIRFERRLGSQGDDTFTCPAFEEIMQTGVALHLALPLISASGEAQGAIAVFDNLPGSLEEPARATVQTLCDLARLAIEHRQLYEEVVHRSQYDRLTGLPNRLLLEDRLRQAMITARRQGSLVGVCCIDLDRFKQVNDSLGHDLGDTCFKLVSERLHASVRDIDTLARHGGDEFILALRDLSETSDATAICDRLLQELSAPVLLEGHAVSITASIGISIFPDHGDTPDALLRNADLALQAAKRNGRAQGQVYSPGLGRQTRRAAEMVEALAGAVASAQLRLAYQPIFTMDREIVGMEALLRWKHPKWGQISPLEFIPIAEKSGQIVSIGDWVLDEVCRQAVEWDSAAVAPVKMFANISGVQLARSDFASKIARTLERTGLAPERLELEITESWIISDLKGAACKLQKLRDLGIAIAIDDFGTGYSTFNYLQELPLDTLKIDRSFIRRLDGSAASLSTVRTITTLAQQLGLKSVAEGVESEDQLEQLRTLGLELMQGFFLARPLRPQAACSLLSKQRCSSPLLGVAPKRPFAGASRAELLT